MNIDCFHVSCLVLPTLYFDFVFWVDVFDASLVGLLWAASYSLPRQNSLKLSLDNKYMLTGWAHRTYLPVQA